MSNLQAGKTSSNLLGGVFLQETANECWPLPNFLRVLEHYNAICIVDLLGKIVYANKSFCSLTKCPSSQLCQQTLKDIICFKHHTEQFYNKLWSTISSGQIWNGLIKNTTKDGESYWAKTSIYPIDEQGAAKGYVVLKTDITEEIELREKTSRLSTLLEEKEQKLVKNKRALDAIVECMEKEKLKILQELLTNFETEVYPLLEDVTEKSEKEKKHLKIIKQNIKNVGKPIFNQTRDWKYKLSSKEMQICSLLKKGLVVKEIATIMRLSEQTVEKHKESVCNKLGLKNQDMNLGAYLLKQSV